MEARWIDFTLLATKADLQSARKNSSKPHDFPPNTITYADSIEVHKLIPRTVSIYQLKGIIGKLLGVKSMSCKLIWETGEWDPIGGGGADSDAGWSVSDEEMESADEGKGIIEDKGKGKDKDKGEGMEVDGLAIEKLSLGEQVVEERNRSKWERREVELVDSTREVGSWVEGKEARIRVEVR